MGVRDSAGQHDNLPVCNQTWPEADRCGQCAVLPATAYAEPEQYGPCANRLSLLSGGTVDGCNHLTQSALAQMEYSTDVQNTQQHDPTQAPDKDSAFLLSHKGRWASCFGKGE
jgi:hypothetical protein